MDGETCTTCRALRAQVAALELQVQLLQLPAADRIRLLFERSPEARKLSQAQLAKALGLRRETICRALSEFPELRRAPAPAAEERQG